MGLVLVVVAGALGLGALLGGGSGGVERLAALRLRWPRLLLAAAACQAAGWLLSSRVAAAWPALLAVSAVLVAGFVLRNVRVVGLPLVGAGLLLNALVVGANAAMPVSPSAAARAGLAAGDLRLYDDPRHEPLDGATRLRWLGDVVPVALPPRPEVASPGDLLVAAGIGLLVVATMTAPAGPGRGQRSTTRERASTTTGSYS